MAEVFDVWKTYDRVRDVLQGVSLSVERGELVVVMGRSGSGKTTLLNLLAGLETPNRGHVLVGGVDLASLDDEARARARLHQIGIVFQRFHLIPELTVEENVRLPMQLARRPEAKGRSLALLRFFGLDAQADAFPATLSGGEMQRAAIARALANEPAVVLADEPTANLDDTNAGHALSALRRVADELGTGVLLATHDALVRDFGDRVLTIAEGRLFDGVVTPRAAPASGGDPTRDQARRA